MSPEPVFTLTWAAEPIRTSPEPVCTLASPADSATSTSPEPVVTDASATAPDSAMSADPVLTTTGLPTGTVTQTWRRGAKSNSDRRSTTALSRSPRCSTTRRSGWSPSTRMLDWPVWTAVIVTLPRSSST
ncbi:MAG: hypothetical protein AAGC63_15875 [Propionicimonas sp.]|nr:hypothetical protein [Propionicimonas sp.]